MSSPTSTPQLPGGSPPDGGLPLTHALRRVGPGWHGLVSRGYGHIAAISATLAMRDVYRESGGLRFGLTGQADRGIELVALQRLSRLEKKSYRTCELCGAAAEPRDGSDGVRRTRCQMHAYDPDAITTFEPAMPEQGDQVA